MKKLTALLMSFLLGLAVFAEDVSNSYDPYAGSDKETFALIQETRDAMEKGQFLTAFNKVKSEDEAYDNEYKLAMATEVAIKGFAQSIMHQMFAFKDLENGESLNQLRSGSGKSFDLILFDPVKTIENFVSAYGEKPILNYALGLYYNDVGNRYRGNWILSDQEVREKADYYLTKAYEEGCYSGESASILAVFSIMKGMYSQAEKFLNIKKDSGRERDLDDNYYMGIIKYELGNTKEALEYEEEAIKDFAEYPKYQLDAYEVCLKICYGTSDLKKAEKYVKRMKEAFPDSYRVPLNTLRIRLLQNKKSDAQKAAMELYSLNPSEAAFLNEIVKEYKNLKQLELLPPFFEEAAKTYRSNDSALELIYYYYSFVEVMLGNYKEAQEKAELAELYFNRTGHMTEEISEFLNSVKANVK